MKPSLSPLPEPAGSTEKIPLLREAVEVLMSELSLLAECKAEELPELKKKKVVLASRLGKVKRKPRLPEAEAFDLATLTGLIHALEAQSRQEIRSHLDLLGKRLLALQEEHQYWRECLNVSFGKFCESVS